MVGVLTNSEEDRRLVNECADEEINDDLLAAGLDLPSFTLPDGSVCGPITPEGKGHPPNRLMEEYIAIELAKRQKNPPPPKNSPPPGSGQPQGKPTHPAAGCGHCGSGGGHEVPGEPPQDDPDGRSDVDQQVTRKQVCNDIKEASKFQGRVPLGLQRFAELADAPAKIPWAQKLARSVRSAVAFKSGSADYTMSRRSRRQGAFFGAELEPLLHGTHTPIAEVAVVADTSGSMGDAQMRKILQEVNGVIKTMAGAKITFLAVDSQVHSHIRTSRLEDVKLAIKGGGGTDFRPAFEALDRAKPRPSVVIFATDGYGSYPEEPPKGINVIWLNIDGRIGVDWGERIDISAEDLDV
jgi:hypothetical protein